MPNFNDFSFKAQPWYNEAEFRPLFAKAVSLNTIVIHCFDPRASEIPAVVAKHFGEDRKSVV